MDWLNSIFGGGSSVPAGGGTSSGKGSSTAESYTGFNTNTASIGPTLNPETLVILGVFAVVIVTLIFAFRK